MKTRKKVLTPRTAEQWFDCRNVEHSKRSSLSDRFDHIVTLGKKAFHEEIKDPHQRKIARHMNAVRSLHDSISTILNDRNLGAVWNLNSWFKSVAKPCVRLELATKVEQGIPQWIEPTLTILKLLKTAGDEVLKDHSFNGGRPIAGNPWIEILVNGAAIALFDSGHGNIVKPTAYGPFDTLIQILLSRVDPNAKPQTFRRYTERFLKERAVSPRSRGKRLK